MSDQWQLRRCVCGNSFGCKGTSLTICAKCGSSNSIVISIVDDSRQLAAAVSNANMPRELANDITKRIQSLEKKSVSYNANNTGNTRTRSIQAMHDATNDAGILAIASLEKELARLGINEHSSQHLIGQAEVEGILLRCGPESWTWLQQSS